MIATLASPTLSSRPPLHLSKRTASASARAALAGASLVQIEGDDGRKELLLTRNECTQRFGDAQLDELEAALADLEGSS